MSIEDNMKNEVNIIINGVRYDAVKDNAYCTSDGVIYMTMNMVAHRALSEWKRVITL